MINIFQQLPTKLSKIFKESLSVALPLYRIIIPMIIVVKILKEIGAVEILGQWMAPLMGLMGLPGSMGLVWAATLVAGKVTGVQTCALPIYSKLSHIVKLHQPG